MKYAVSGKDMKFIDNYTIKEGGIPSLVLMERAAQKVCDELIKDCTDPRDVQFILVCGKGNNGADGIAMARMMKRNELDVRVVLPGVENFEDLSVDVVQTLRATDEWKYQYKNAAEVGVEFNSYNDGFIKRCIQNTSKACTVIVDAMVGIGIADNLAGEIAAAASEINDVRHKNKNVYVYAVDVPSGVGFEPCVYADKVVTFGMVKKEMLTLPGARSIGYEKISDEYINIDENIVVGNIGFLKEAYSKSELYGIVDDEDVSIIKNRDRWGNKGTFGKVFVAGGSTGMCGAGYFAAKSAYRTGAGLVRILCQKESINIYQSLIPEAVLVIDEDNIGRQVAEQVKWSDVTIVGPGLGISDRSRLIVRVALEAAKKYNKSLIIDADALNVIAMEKELTNLYFPKVVITPHIGEMSRLTGFGCDEIKKDIISVGKTYAYKHKINVILKDARSVITDGEKTYINIYGNSGMAKAGSGDVLTGIVAGVICVCDDTMPISYYCAVASAIHGMAAEKATENMLVGSLMATDIIEGIGKINI